MENPNLKWMIFGTLRNIHLKLGDDLAVTSRGPKQTSGFIPWWMVQGQHTCNVEIPPYKVVPPQL